MKKVVIEPGCTSCGTCAFIADDIFEVTEYCRVKKSCIEPHDEEKVEQAVQACPVNVIRTEEMK